MDKDSTQGFYQQFFLFKKHYNTGQRPKGSVKKKIMLTDKKTWIESLSSKLSYNIYDKACAILQSLFVCSY